MVNWGFGQANYSAAKAGLVIRLLQGCGQRMRAKDNGKRYYPGFVATEMVLSIPEKVMTNIVNLPFL